MAQLAKVELVAKPACPGCRRQVDDLVITEITDGIEHQCLYCGETMRIPRQILERLVAQSEQLEQAPQDWFSALLSYIKSLFS